MTIKNPRTSHAREVLDERAFAEINERFGAIQDWWIEHRLGAYNEDHIAAVTLDFDDVPLAEILSILNKTLARAPRKPYSLRYFKVALEEGRGEYFKRQDPGRLEGNHRSMAETFAEIIARQRRPGAGQ